MEENRFSADIEWDENGQPISKHYGDVYFSKDNGLEETRYVFITGNHLSQKFSELNIASLFTIAETGFGTGLNFLATWQQWIESAPKGAKLHFISCEKFPLNKSDLKKSLALWPELSHLSDQLIRLYPPTTVRGFHRINLNDHIALTLIFDDVFDAFTQLLPIEKPGNKLQNTALNWSHQYTHSSCVDAWFLDGFAPAKNPDMWQPTLFNLMARLSKPHASFATFTAASIVKNALNASGFEIKKTKGFGRKREMLVGHFPASLDSQNRTRRKPDSSWHLSVVEKKELKKIAVIGAGLAGAHTAFALAKRGYQVDVFDKGRIAHGGSGNPAGVLYTKLSPENNPHAAIHIAALSYALNFYHQFNLFNTCGQACGVLQLAHTEKLEEQFKNIAEHHIGNSEFIRFVDKNEASALSSVELQQAALYFPTSGWLNPKKVCTALLNHPNIHLHENTSINALEQNHEGWTLISENNANYKADAFVLCNAQNARELEICKTLPTKAIRGQISLAEPTASSRGLQTVLCGEGYIAPSIKGLHCLGASFNLKNKDPEPTEKDHQFNIQQAQKLSGNFQSLRVENIDSGRASFRCATPDYLPIVGPIANEAAMLEQFAPYRSNSKHVIDAPGSYLPGAFVNVGHGSKGLCTTPLSAEIIANLIHGEVPALPKHLMLHIHSARFLIRDLARNRL